MNYEAIPILPNNIIDADSISPKTLATWQALATTGSIEDAAAMRGIAISTLRKQFAHTPPLSPGATIGNVLHREGVPYSEFTFLRKGYLIAIAGMVAFHSGFVNRDLVLDRISPNIQTDSEIENFLMSQLNSNRRDVLFYSALGLNEELVNRYTGSYSRSIISPQLHRIAEENGMVNPNYTLPTVLFPYYLSNYRERVEQTYKEVMALEP